jgi:hypothetical protein
MNDGTAQSEDAESAQLNLNSIDTPAQMSRDLLNRLELDVLEKVVFFFLILPPPCAALFPPFMTFLIF